MPAGLPLTQAHRIGADSCPLAATNPSPVESPHVTARSAMCLFCCAHRNILNLPCLVLSMETRLGQAAPLVVAMEAILAACPLVVEVEAVPVGCPVLSVWPWRAFLSCFVLSCLFSPGGLLIPPHFPREILGGG